MYLETSSRSVISSSSDKSLVILFSILRSFKISSALVRPIPWIYCNEYWTLLLLGISTPPTRAHLMLNPPTCNFHSISIQFVQNFKPINRNPNFIDIHCYLWRIESRERKRTWRWFEGRRGGADKRDWRYDGCCQSLSHNCCTSTTTVYAMVWWRCKSLPKWFLSYVLVRTFLFYPWIIVYWQV